MTAGPRALSTTDRTPYERVPGPPRAATMTEARLLGAVRYLAKLYGWRFYHTHDSRRSDPGFPDCTMVHPQQQRIVFAELKTTTGRTTPEQDAWLADLVAAGAEAYLWRPADLERVIPGVLRGRTASTDRGLSPLTPGEANASPAAPPARKDP